MFINIPSLSQAKEKEKEKFEYICINFDTVHSALADYMAFRELKVSGLKESMLERLE